MTNTRTTRAILLGSLLAAAALGGCNAGLPPDVATLGYVNREHRFAMNVPPGWTCRDATGAAVIVTAPLSADEGRPNVNVTVIPGGGTMTLDELVRSSRTGLGQLRGLKLLSEGPFTPDDGHKAWTAVFEDASVGTTVRQRQLYVVAGSRAYIVTAAAVPDAFAREEPNFDICFRSFRAGW